MRWSVDLSTEIHLRDFLAIASRDKNNKNCLSAEASGSEGTL